MCWLISCLVSQEEMIFLGRKCLQPWGIVEEYSGFKAIQFTTQNMSQIKKKIKRTPEQNVSCHYPIIILWLFGNTQLNSLLMEFLSVTRNMHGHYILGLKSDNAWYAENSVMPEMFSINCLLQFSLEFHRVLSNHNYRLKAAEKKYQVIFLCFQKPWITYLPDFKPSCLCVTLTSNLPSYYFSFRWVNKVDIQDLINSGKISQLVCVYLYRKLPGTERFLYLISNFKQEFPLHLVTQQKIKTAQHQQFCI